MHKGIATLITVILVSILALFVMIAWQSRILLSIQRYQSLSDSLIVTYRAESTINDWIAKFLDTKYGANIYNKTPDSAPPGSVQYDESFPNKLRVTAYKTGDTEYLNIAAARPYASTSFLLSRQLGSSSGGFERAEVIFGLDCSGSMGPVRINSLQKALLAFLNQIQASPDRDKFYLGFIPFKKSAAWAYGTDASLRNDVAALYAKINESEWWNVGAANVSLCYDVKSELNKCPYDLASCSGGETNLGSPGVIAANYYATHPADPAKVLRTYVVFTDGLPNTATRNDACGVSACNSSEDAGTCENNAVNYLACSLAKTNKQWRPGYVGMMPTDVDVFAATVADAPGGGNAKSAYDRTNAIFNDTSIVKQAYSNSNATKLAEIFKDIFTQINASVQNIKIQRLP